MREKVGSAMTEGEKLRAKPDAPMVGLLLMQMIIGYEWFISGLVKIVHGDFPPGLADEMLKKLPAAVGWYGTFVQSIVIPNASAFGYAIEIAELLAGVVLLVGPLIWLVAWDRVPGRVRRTVLFFIAVATIGGAFLAINLHLLNAGGHPWLFPNGSFDEGVDLDSVLPALQVVIAWISIVFLRRLGRTSVEGNRFNQRSRIVEAV